MGETLVRHPDVRVISPTGSRETGVVVLKAVADGLKHVHSELGGKNAIIVLDDADPDLAVEGIIWSAFGTSGQRCTAASRVIVQRGIYEELQGEARGGRGRAEARPRLGGRHRRRPCDQQALAREDPLALEIGKDEGRSSSRGARWRPATGSPTASTTGRRSSATSSRKCASPRRRPCLLHRHPGRLVRRGDPRQTASSTAFPRRSSRAT